MHEPRVNAGQLREEQQAATVNEAETSRYVLARGRGTVDHDVDGGTRRFRRSDLHLGIVAPRLEVIGGHEPASLVLTPGQAYLVGRADESDLQLRDGRVSRRHARLVYQDGSWWIEDLQTTNGTRINGVPIRRERLRDGDEITVGLTTIRQHVHDHGAVAARALLDHFGDATRPPDRLTDAFELVPRETTGPAPGS